MSAGEQLFVRGMKTEENDDIWDDTQLVKAYDKAMKNYKPVDMAKRIAMATNAKSGDKSKLKWQVGSACRAVFDDDGQEYEAYIIDIIDKNECVIRYVGYGDDATVKLCDLKPSHGTAARSQQVYNITTEPSWKEIMKADFGVEESALDSASEAERKEKKTDAVNTPDRRHSDASKHKRTNKNKKHKRKQMHTPLNCFPDPSKLPVNFDAINSFVADCPGLYTVPPVPPMVPLGTMDTDEHELLNNMLTAWYMSGYYAGVYQSSMKKKSKKSINT